MLLRPIPLAEGWVADRRIVLRTYMFTQTVYFTSWSLDDRALAASYQQLIPNNSIPCKANRMRNSAQPSGTDEEYMRSFPPPS